MKVCVTGLWHLGTVTAACLAAAGHSVTGHDPDRGRVESMAAGDLPIQEPGLDALVHDGLASGRLSFEADAWGAVHEAEVLWVTHDTEVGDMDRADPASVSSAVEEFFPHLASGSLVLISSQLPVGTTKKIERSFQASYPDRTVWFAYSPENLRLGSAIESFTRPSRIVVGLDGEESRSVVAELLGPLNTQIEWMSVVSAEMTKHALNSFLATSVVFANEIATICESVGADVSDVVRALRGDARIGQGAYLGVGTGFSGGTLGRDVVYLADASSQYGIDSPLIASIGPSNRHQQTWVQRTLISSLGDLGGKKVAVWGLTYKPGTDTLRRSAAVELCEWLVTQGARPCAYDPAVPALPAELASSVALEQDALSAARDVDALVVMTAWPDFQLVPVESLIAEMRTPLVVDPGRVLGDTVRLHPNVRYAAVGIPRT